MISGIHAIFLFFFFESGQLALLATYLKQYWSVATGQSTSFSYCSQSTHCQFVNFLAAVLSIHCTSTKHTTSQYTEVFILQITGFIMLSIALRGAISCQSTECSIEVV